MLLVFMASNIENLPLIKPLTIEDLCGPMKTATLGGARNFMLIIDDFSRKVWVYL